MKKFKRGATLSLLGGLALVLSGCVRTKNGHPYGFVYDYLAKPAQHVMEWLTQYVGSYGWAIIVLTVIVRMVLLPMMVSQMKKSTIQQEKMQLVRPQMDIITKRQKEAKTQEEQAAASQQMMKLYRDNGISMTGGIGCLPLLIQMPIFAALYAAIRYSPELSHTVFMGIRLGETSWVLAVLSFLAYLLQGYLSMLGTPASQKKQMASMMLLSPIMILFFTLSAPAGLGLYFFIGGLFACVQTLIIDLYRPKIRRDVEKEMGEIKQVVVDDIPTPVSEEQEDHSLPTSPKKNNRNRNAGKQHRNK
ncbi:YidC Oxa1 family membrane protein insertase [Lentilactobacillus senioris DSM 24302 = JCM 17472]|uniref:YidC Oxa1 family membrane protein insertase n=1 Tax=Lentilactobacillus senioris DSM 24302 = JCM 17472 TaxID=1423802 RepID=A0A0R2CQ75_9LACO|nr:membrane protein insertase YidC [Lentilactobacillus senioris]KRM93933.1 YidC Oxa1 family membrane protein insertase [Lentilactobacillus senioris DSM 24302 = JCM 17472]